MKDTPQAVQIDTGPDPDWSIIWLHGLGADGHDFEPMVPELDLPAAVRFTFPHAPVRPVTINGGYPMRAWYDIFALERGGPEDEDGIRASASRIGGLIRQEIERGIPASRVIVAGFSQGGAIALHTALRYPEPVAGILGLSTYVPLADTLAAELGAGSRRVPIFMGHGTHDSTVPESFGAHTRDLLRTYGYDVAWHTYPMGHAVCAREILDLNHWLRKRLSASA